MSLREGYLHDYLVASFIGLAYGVIVASPTGGLIGDWGAYVGVLVVAGIFGFIPGGLVAGYINFRLHKMDENTEMAGLSAGFFTAFVYTIIDFFISVELAIVNQRDAGNTFIAWIISAIFAFIFFTIGGYISGMFERRPFGMPGLFNLSRISRMPPPPPVAPAQTCPTCGGQLRYIEQYQRWYCDKEKKYV